MWLFDKIFGGFVRPELKSWKRTKSYDFNDLLLTFEDGSQYIGDCTVWRSWPECSRCGSFKESWLSDVWAAIEYGVHNDKEEK